MIFLAGATTNERGIEDMIRGQQGQSVAWVARDCR